MPEFILEQQKIRQDYKEKPIQDHRKIFWLTIWNKTGKGLLFLLLFAIIIPPLVYYLIYDVNIDKDDEFYTCAINKTYKIQCGESNATQTYCENINCCFDNTTKLCFHYIPSKYYYYSNNNNNSYTSSLPTTPFKNRNFDNIALTVNEIDENRISVSLHHQEIVVEPLKLQSKNYFYKIYPDRGAVEIFRNTSELLLTTAKGPLIVSQNYWEWSFQLTEEYLFGLGETLIEPDEYSTFTKVIYCNYNDQSSLPIFLANSNGRFHGLIVRHDGPLEVTVLPSKLVSLKSLSGDTIELELSVGPTVKQVLEQQRQLIDKQQILDDWILGTHLCRGGSLVELGQILDEFEQVNTLYDSDCIHENLLLAILMNEDNSLVDRLQNIVGKLINSRQFVLSVPPQVPTNSSLYKRTTNFGVYYKNENGSDYFGNYLGLQVVYPYYQHPNVNNFIAILLEEIQRNLGFLPINLIFNNNWPMNDKYHMNKTNQFPYLSQSLIDAMSTTIPWNILGDNHQHILYHNDYGSMQSKVIKDAIKSQTGQEVFTMTASHNLITGQLNAVLIQTSNTTWSDFRLVIKKLLFNSLFVTQFVSAPVCGSTEYFDAKLNESLCIRWYLMAGTMPLLRLSSDPPQRDPDSLNSGYASNLTKFVINQRNMFKSHHLTTIFNGQLWIRPMFYDFENDTKTYPLYSQYMIGDQILVAHPVLPDAKRLWIYLPPKYEIWYELWGGISYNTTKNNTILFDIVETDWISFLPQGKIIHLIEEQTDKNSVKLIIGLECNGTNNCQASGNWLIGTTLLNLEATQNFIKIDKITDDIRQQMDCDRKHLIVEELRYYHPNLPNFKLVSIDLCIEDGYIEFDSVY